jgi:signal transduction histidine kinase
LARKGTFHEGKEQKKDEEKRLVLKFRLIFLFIFSFFLILIFIFSFNRFNRNEIKNQFENLTVAEGMTIRNLIQVSGKHLSEEGGEEELKSFLDSLYENTSIIYLGLFKDSELVYLLSRFEGYFPVIPDPDSFHVLDSPIGKIFDIKGEFVGKYKRKHSFKLHIGFNYEFLTTFEKVVQRNFIIVALLFSSLFFLIIGLVVYFDKRFFNKELELEREKVEKERFKELSLLTSEIAHEIKNPLNSIYLSFQTLEKYVSAGEEADFYKSAIKGEIKRINRIINSYSELSRDLFPQITSIDIQSYINEFRLMSEGYFKEKEARLMVSFSENITFKTDPDLLKQVLMNLIQNSLEADAKLVEVIISGDKKRLFLEVRDNGKGIDEKLVEKVFKPYMSTKIKGMGLGLHIVLKILKSLKGTLKLEFHSAGNTCFRIEIPGGE